MVACIQEHAEGARVIILTGYGNIAMAVAAVKARAVDYLAKPIDADQVEAALLVKGDRLPPPPKNPMSADRKGGSIFSAFMSNAIVMSETARKLNMHRRTSQRIL